MVKIPVYSYGAKFDLHCPRCGGDEFTVKPYKSTPTRYYRHCKTCGADVEHHNEKGSLDLTVVVEERFYEYSEQPEKFDVALKDSKNYNKGQIVGRGASKKHKGV